MAEIYTSAVKNYIQRNGFVMVSNLLIDFQEELGITEGEFVFLLKVLRNKTNCSIHDSELDKSVSSKTLSRRRNSLRDKGLINFSVLKKQDENGKFKTDGISYDLSPLEAKLQELSDIIETKKEKQIKREVSEQKILIEDTEENSPLIKYQNDYFNYYGVEYKFNQFEINKYNSLSEENKKIIAYVFEYCEENNLFDKIVPRLSLFFKASFRFADLKKWYKHNINEEIKETNEPKIDYALEYFKKYYPTGRVCLNLSFYRMIEKIINDNKEHVDSLDEEID